eukprot:TRINITY_DN1879_c0_g1_i1.p1 TRINITY_DN1879_c0_g1~~TRINITY_DN1879_c0_g1_i1.p1  ORF type:complete len:143 (-),score=28.20 TRINITY_DN1879_c0_g1_i1:221-649(-)
MLTPREVPDPKKLKKNRILQAAPINQLQGENEVKQEILPPSSKTRKLLKRSLKNEIPQPSQQPERSTSDSMPDSSRSGSEYRALRRKYLLLEEESFLLGRDLTEVETEVKTLEDEKLALLDQLVVLEGLVDPLEIQPHRHLS